ncbi:MAG: type II toxin-antitoxin system VapC family toxin [Gemmatimonadaceae bacterium]
MRAADTNVLVRLIARDDAKQVAAAEHFVAAGAWISHLVLAETTWVLESVFDLGRREIATAVEMLLDHDRLTIQDSDVVRAAVTQLRRKPTVGFSDCLILEIARKAGHLPLGTFDRQLGSLADAERI